MEDIDYGTLFGIDEGENVQEPAEPENTPETEQGANEQEPAAPAVGNSTPEADKNGAGEPAAVNAPNTEPAAQPGVQPPEERARFAAARRRAEAERDAAIDRARREAAENARRAVDEAFAASGIINPYTQKPITSKAEFDEYRAKYEAEQRARILEQSGMSDEEFKSFVEGLPEVRQAREAKRQAEEAASRAREQQARLNIEEQLREISAIDPAVKELGDLMKLENYPRFYELVKRGNTLVDAYKLANFDALSGRAAEASRQAAINAAQSKQHLSQTSQRGSGAVSVPADVKAAYLEFNPQATDAEIQQHYNRYLNKK